MVDRSTLGTAMQRESPEQGYWYTARPFGNVRVTMNSNSGSHWLELAAQHNMGNGGKWHGARGQVT